MYGSINIIDFGFRDDKDNFISFKDNPKECYKFRNHGSFYIKVKHWHTENTYYVSEGTVFGLMNQVKIVNEEMNNPVFPKVEGL